MKQTTLFREHEKLNAVMTDFAGWQMPLQYEGIISEHIAVRQSAGLFDVSHMGEIKLSGKDAFSFLQSCITKDISKLQDGATAYTLICHEQGGVLDDLLVYRLSLNQYMLVVNASNTKKIFNWLKQRLKNGPYRDEAVRLENISDQINLIALQGPAAGNILQQLASDNLQLIRPFHFREEVKIAGRSVLLSRTGYTGEDGFELYCSPNDTPDLWQILLETGQPVGIKAAGLGARDTLRLEAGMPLYGHEINETISPFEAGLGSFVSLDKPDFTGKQALQKSAADYKTGKLRQRIGFRMIKRIPAREGCRVLIAGKEAGYVTSGGFMPWLKISAGMALVNQALLKDCVSPEALKLEIDIRGRLYDAVWTGLPFYRRGNKKASDNR